MSEPDLVFKPVTVSEWNDMQALFAENPFRGCWCMYWRLKRKEHERGYGECNRLAMQGLIESGKVPGLLVYAAGRPAGWVSTAPREDFGALERSRLLKRIDDRPVWSIVCFMVAKRMRGKGMMRSLIRGAVNYAASQGAQIVEAYPLIPEMSKNPAQSIYMGVVEAFRKAGFVEVAQPSSMRLIMRYFIEVKEEYSE